MIDEKKRIIKNRPRLHVSMAMENCSVGRLAFHGDASRCHVQILNKPKDHMMKQMIHIFTTMFNDFETRSKIPFERLDS